MTEPQVDTYLPWIDKFIPNPSYTQRAIYERWIKRLAAYYEETLPPDFFKHNNAEKFFLQKTLTYFFPFFSLIRSPFFLPDLDKAIAILQTAFKNKDQTRIVLYGDRDADGITSSSICFLFLTEQMGFKPAQVITLLPEQEDKYGITEKVADRILSNKPDVIIALDCGSSNKESFDYIKANSDAKTIIIDHHFLPATEADYPPVDAFVNPKKLDTKEPERDMCTAAIALKLIWGLTYSFTAEYNGVSKVTGNGETYYLRNGIPVSETDNWQREFCFDEDAVENDKLVNGAQWWQRAVKQNVEVNSLNTICQRHPEIIDLPQKYAILQNLALKKLFDKIKKYFALAAAGTIADLMPLVDDNRILVSFGLKLMKSKIMPRGLLDLMTASGIADRLLSEQDLGFTICPAINAAGRLGRPQEALKVLIETDPIEASKKAFALMTINQERKALSKQGMAALEESLSDRHLEYPIVIAYHPEVHRGISGIVASRLAERFKKPAIVLVEDGDCLRGSARAFETEDVFSLLKILESHFIQYGGHRQAAGFSLEHEKKDKFIDAAYEESTRFYTSAEKEVADEGANKSFSPPLEVRDQEIISRSWQDWLSFAPYGILNPHPVVAIKPTQRVGYEAMGQDKNHARINFGGIADASIEGVWFFHGEDISRRNERLPEKIIAEPHLNYFGGRIKYQLKIKKVLDEFAQQEGDEGLS